MRSIDSFLNHVLFCSRHGLPLPAEVTAQLAQTIHQAHIQDRDIRDELAITTRRLEKVYGTGRDKLIRKAHALLPGDHLSPWQRSTQLADRVAAIPATDWEHHGVPAEADEVDRLLFAAAGMTRAALPSSPNRIHEIYLENQTETEEEKHVA